MRQDEDPIKIETMALENQSLHFNPCTLITFALTVCCVTFTICYEMSIRKNWVTVRMLEGMWGVGMGAQTRGEGGSM